MQAVAGTRSSPVAICPRRYGEVVIERGLAQAWGIPLGGTLHVRGLGPQRVVGFAEAPDNVGFPLAVPRFYLSAAALNARFGPRAEPTGQRRGDLAARPALPERGARTGENHQLRPARAAVHHPLRRSRAARPGGGDRDRSARRAVGVRARDRRCDARRVGAGRGAATAEDDRDQPCGRRLARPRGQRAGRRGGHGRGPGRDHRDARWACSRPWDPATVC